VVVSLQSQVANVAANFKDVLEVRTKNIQASRSRQDNFVSSVSARSQIVDSSRSESPLYQSTAAGSGMGGRPQSRSGYNSNPDLLSLDPSSSSSALMRGSGGQQSDQQLLIMEEAQPTNTYIQQRGEAIESIERTINELGSIFGQLAGMVSEVSHRQPLLLKLCKCCNADI
jgi:syntaxin 5